MLVKTFYFRKRKNNNIFVNNLNFSVNRSDQQFKKKNQLMFNYKFEVMFGRILH